MYSHKIIDAETHDQFFREFTGFKSFLQTSNYARFRTALGEPTDLHGFYRGDTLVGVAVIQYIPAKKASFFHVPHGILTADSALWTWFLEFYKELGREAKVDFVRISPPLSPTAESIFHNAKYLPSAVHLQNPEQSWVLDLTPPLEELVAQMSKDTRYEIRRIEKLGVTTTMGNSPQDLDEFWRLHSLTVARQKFVPFPRSSTEKELEIFGSDAQIFTASFEGQNMASSLILFDSHAGYYHQGASERCKAPVAYATLYSAIQEAKKRNLKEFNFWGVVGVEEKSHPWYGLSQFKRGFGGFARDYLHAQDFPLTKKYHLSRLVEKYRKWKRHY